MRFQCPKCGQSLVAQPHQAGATASCPACGQRFAIPKPQVKLVVPGGGAAARAPVPGAAAAPAAAPPPAGAPAASAPAPSPAPSAPGPKPGASVSDGRLAVYAFMLGVGATVFFYLGLTPFAKSQFAQVMAQRGWVVYAETLFMFWALAILMFKWFRLRTERKALLLDVLPVEIGTDITKDNVDRFTEHIDRLPARYAQSVMVRRLRQGLEHFRARGSNPEVANLMNVQSELDAGSVAGSYTLIKVFLWAIPILGFIGTVIGISQAITGFSIGSGGAMDMSALTGSINKVTAGLGVAFDTTYVALVMSMLLSFPASGLQKSEEDLVGAVDTYVLENFLLRLRDSGGLADIAGSTGALANALAPLLAESHQNLLVELRKLQDGILESQRRQLELFEQTNKALREQTAGIDTQMKGLVESLQSEASKTLGKAASDLSGTVTNLVAGLQGLNKVLKELGEKQVVIQKVKKGWFS